MVERVSVAKGVSISHKKSGGEVSGDEIRGKQQAGPNTANWCWEKRMRELAFTFAPARYTRAHLSSPICPQPYRPSSQLRPVECPSSQGRSIPSLLM